MPEEKNKKTATISPSSPPPAALGQADDGSGLTRRSFFSWLSIGWIAFVAATGGFFTMMLRFFSPMYYSNPLKH